MSSSTIASPPGLASGSASTSGGRRSHRSGLVLAVILTCQLMVVLDATIVNVALPQIQSAMSFSATDLSWVLNAYTLAFGGLLLLGARAGDLLGRRRTFVAGIALFTFASLLGGFAPSGGLLLAARALQGVGAAIAAPSSLALLTTMFSEPRERMRAIGLFTSVSVGGGALGLIAGGILVEWTNWRWVMFVNVPIGIALVVLGRSVLPETERHHGRFDLPGALFSTLGMSSLVYGFVRAASSGWTDTFTIASFVAGLVLLTVFAVVELRADSPITPLRLLADRSRTSAIIARGFLFAGLFGLFFFLGQYLQDVLNYSPLQTGFAFLPLPVTVFVMSQLTSKVLVRKVNGKVLMLGGIAAALTGFLLLSQLTPESPYLRVIGSLLLVAVGNGLSIVPLTGAAIDRVAPQDAGAASGLVNVTQQLGGTLGVAILVTVFGSAAGNANPLTGVSPAAEAAHVFTVGATHAFTAATLFLLAAMALVAVAVKAPKARTSA